MTSGFVAALLPALVLPQTASAGDRLPVPPQPMDCLGYPARIAVPSMRLSDALVRFRSVYRCGVSMRAGKVGGSDAGDLRSTRIDGRYAPLRALRIMVGHTPLKVRPLRGGFNIHR